VGFESLHLRKAVGAVKRRPWHAKKIIPEKLALLPSNTVSGPRLVRSQVTPCTQSNPSVILTERRTGPPQQRPESPGEFALSAAIVA